MIAGICAAMRRDLDMYLEARQRWLDVLKSAGRSSEYTKEFTVGPDEECALPNSLGIELGRLPAPTLGVSSNGYSYREMRHLFMTEGRLHFGEGSGSTVLELHSTPRDERQTDRRSFS